MSPGARQGALAGVAVLLVGALLVDQLAAPRAGQVAPAEAPADAAPVRSGGAAGAPAGLDHRALAARYASIVEARPFEARSFRSEPRPQPRRPDRSARPSDPAPAALEVRFTGFLGLGPARVAVLEERTSGQGLLAAAGRQLGGLTVAEVRTDSLVVVEGQERREVPLGEALSLPAALSRELTRLGAPAPDPSLVRPSGAPAAGGEAKPVIEEGQRQEILDRLRNQRRRSLGSEGQGGS